MQSGPTAVASASVTLYKAGTAYASGATNLGTATSDGSGNFTVSYTPPSPAAELYVVATGGNAGGGTNSAVGLMGVAGLSNALPGSVTINEFTTVAGEWALAQFTDSTGRIIGAPSTNATGLENAASQAQANLADIGTGGPAAFWTTYGINAGTCASSPPVNCDGLKRMNTFANILAACDETSGPSSGACATLLSDTGSGSTTLQAAHYMATHLTASVSGLYALQAGSPPFTPALSSAPDGWELALHFVPTGANFSAPEDLAIDSAGNAWVANYLGNSVTELTPSGGLADYFDNINTSGAGFDFPFGVAIDASGNAWVANSTGGSDSHGSLTELNSSGALVGSYNNTNTSGANFDFPYLLAIDASGNVWAPNNSNNSITELSSGGALVGNYAPSGSDFDEPFGIAIDASGNAWVTNTSGNSVTVLASNGTLAGNYDPSGSNFNNPDGIAIDASGNAWMTNNLGNTVTELDSSGGFLDNFTNINTSGANFDAPYNVAIDSAGNAWVMNNSGNSVTEMTSLGALAGNFAPVGAALTTPVAAAIDGSGNVWIANNGGSVAEFIGAAGPVLTPLEACLTQATPAAVCKP